MAYSFSNSTDNIDYGDQSIPSGAFTFYAHFTIDAADASHRYIISWYAGGVIDMWLEFNDWTTNSMAFGFMDSSLGSYPQTVWTTGFTAGSTHRVWGIFDGTTQRIYADTDTTHKSTNTPSNPQATGVGRMRLANGPAIDSGLDGDIHEFAFFNRAITSGEQLAMAAGYSAAFFRPYYHMPLIRSANEVVRSAVGDVGGAVAATHDRIIYPAYANNRRFLASAGVSPSVLRTLPLLGAGL